MRKLGSLVFLISLLTNSCLKVSSSRKADTISDEKISERQKQVDLELAKIKDVDLPPSDINFQSADWAEVRKQRQAALVSFLTDNADDFRFFTHGTVGKGGMPYDVLMLLPDIFPEIWGDWQNKTGLPKDPFVKKLLPLGMIDTPGLDVGWGFTPIRAAGFTCGSCHIGRVRDEKGEVNYLIGAPNTTWDPNLLKKMLIATVNDPRYTVDNFQKVFRSKPKDFLYPYQDDDRVKTIMSNIIYKFDSTLEVVLRRLKEALSEPNYVGKFVYDEPDRLYGGTPGRADVTVPMFALVETASILNKPEHIQRSHLQKYLPPLPSPVDFMSTWGQSKRRAGQWDGSINDPLLRNIGAEVANLSSVDGISWKNAVHTTKFLQHLPPPPYPFNVDLKKAELGRRIYKYACSVCHDNGVFIGIDQIKTDEGRARAITEPSRQAVVAAMFKVCRENDEDNPSCNITSEQAVTPRAADPGYMAPPLDGIWARAPYMHNGAIPTIYHVLVPDERPETFYRANIEFDQEKVGFVWDKKVNEYAAAMDTRKPGNHNTGHGLENAAMYFRQIDFKSDHEKREALLEYLKTL